MSEVVDEMEEIDEYLRDKLDTVKCGYCDKWIIGVSGWANGHVPYVEINDDTVKAGYICPEHSDEPIIMLMYKRRDGVTRILP